METKEKCQADIASEAHEVSEELKINNTQTNPKYHYNTWLCNFCRKTVNMRFFSILFLQDG